MTNKDTHYDCALGKFCNLDRDYEFVKKFVLKLWQSEIKKSNVTVLDAKTKLQEY